MMNHYFWQSRITLVMLGVLLGLVARGVLGEPESEVPEPPGFDSPLPAEVPLTLPLLEETLFPLEDSQLPERLK